MSFLFQLFLTHFKCAGNSRTKHPISKCNIWGNVTVGSKHLKIMRYIFESHTAHTSHAHHQHGKDDDDGCAHACGRNHNNAYRAYYWIWHTKYKIYVKNEIFTFQWRMLEVCQTNSSSTIGNHLYSLCIQYGFMPWNASKHICHLRWRPGRNCVRFTLHWVIANEKADAVEKSLSAAAFVLWQCERWRHAFVYKSDSIENILFISSPQKWICKYERDCCIIQMW